MKSAGTEERCTIKKSYSVENGYPARRRSLVDDAKFETSINKQQKQNLLEEAQKISLDDTLSEEEVFIIHSPYEEDSVRQIYLLVTLVDGVSSLGRVLKAVENFKGVILYVESRPVKAKEATKNKYGGGPVDVLLKLEIFKEPLMNLLKVLRQGNSTAAVKLLADHCFSFKEPWFPRHISELDLCNHLMTKFEPDLDMEHPGFSDKDYRLRRQEIAEIAFSYKYGEPIPRVEYRPEEIQTWAEVFAKLDSLVPTHACKEYRLVWCLLKKECGYGVHMIPQLEDVSRFMQRQTGFCLRPAAGLVTARDFLASLAYRVFQCTQYVRHHSSPHHSPEPDVIHELLGHAPLLADSAFAKFSQDLGLASLGATDEEIEQFATLYWFTVEFGLCREKGEIKAWGAGLLSSYGELQHALSDKPDKKPFDPSKTALQPYQDQDYQDLYFVAESIEDAQEKFGRWTSERIKRPYDVHYDPYSQSVRPLDSAQCLALVMTDLTSEMKRLNSAVEKISSVVVN